MSVETVRKGVLPAPESPNFGLVFFMAQTKTTFSSHIQNNLNQSQSEVKTTPPSVLIFTLKF
jgi:hypothetical protein